MAEENLVNTQIRDSVQFANHTVTGHAASQSASMLDTLMAETIGMAMYNAVNTQHNAQMVSSAAVAASCAKMLKVQAVPWLAPAIVPVNPVVTGVTPPAAPSTAYTVNGSGFAVGLSVEIFQNGALLETLSGSAISNVTAISFSLQSVPLAPGGTFTIQVVNADQGRSAPFSFTVASTQPS